MEFILYIALAVVILLLMIVIHEFGHYIAGKILKFKINEFSIGFGPKLLSKKKKNGEVFSLRLIPLGGFCAFEGESDPIVSPPRPTEVSVERPVLVNPPLYKEVDKDGKPLAANKDTADKPQNNFSTSALDGNQSVSGQPTVSTEQRARTFDEEKAWKRIIVLISGGFFNLISAVIFSFICILIVGYAVPRVQTVYYSMGETPAPYSQLMEGDEIIAVNGKEVGVMKTFEDLAKGAELNDTLNVTVQRNGGTIIIPIKVQHVVSVDGEEKIDYTGFGFKSDRIYINGSFVNAVKYCVPFMLKLSWSILGSFFDLVTGQIPITSLTGPIGTVGMMAQLSALNWRNILLLLPLIASNLGLFNLLPIPALDGSKVVFTTIEWVRGKPINRKVENYIHTVGLLVLFAFVIIIDVVGLILR